MGVNDTDIKARLVFDDAASKTLEAIKGGFGKVDSAIHYTKNELLGFVKQSAAMALGFQFDRGIQSIKGWANEAMDAAKVAGTQAKEIAAVLAVNDKTGASYDELKKRGAVYRTELQNIGIEAGASASAVIEAFEDISERSEKSVEQNEALVKQMIQAGKVVPSGLAGITEGYRMFEMGLIRARNPLVQLIASTHMLKGSTRDVAKELTKMGAERATEVATKAIAFMAEKVGKTPLTGGQVIQSIKDMSDQVMEGAGGALLKAMSKPHAVIRQLFIENKAGLEALYTKAGTALGGVITDITEKAKEGIDYVKLHSDEIKADIKEGWDHAKSVVMFIVEHKKEIALGLGAVSAAHIVPAVAGAATGAAGAVATGAGGAWSILKFLGSADVPALTANLGGLSKQSKVYGEVIKGFLYPLTTQMSDEAKTLSGNLGAAAKGMGALALAVGAVYLAIDQYKKLTDEMKVDSDAKAGSMKVQEELARQGNSEQLANTLRVETSLGHISKQWASTLQLMADNADSQFAMVKDEADKAFSGVNAGFIDPVQGMADAYNTAASFQNKAAMTYAAKLMLSSQYTADTLVAMGVKLEGGLKGFEDLFEGATGDLAEKLKRFVGSLDHKEIKAAAPHIDFSNSKFEIHQDFRGEDPERIMFMFRHDILRSAEHRRQSRMGTPFGL